MTKLKSTSVDTRNRAANVQQRGNNMLSKGHQTPRIHPGACTSPHPCRWNRDGYITSAAYHADVRTGDKAHNQRPSDGSERPTWKGDYRLCSQSERWLSCRSMHGMHRASVGIHTQQTVSHASRGVPLRLAASDFMDLFYQNTNKPERRTGTPPPMRHTRTHHSSPRMNAGVSWLDLMN